jgi:alkanesulfonate monooxygenase SsuD/methylene tetrahydromethanopterin reductase-like flavin-dependent oxidoreductase (luciferase family)
MNSRTSNKTSVVLSPEQLAANIKQWQADRQARKVKVAFQTARNDFTKNFNRISFAYPTNWK